MPSFLLKLVFFLQRLSSPQPLSVPWIMMIPSYHSSKNQIHAKCFQTGFFFSPLILFLFYLPRPQYGIYFSVLMSEGSFIRSLHITWMVFHKAFSNLFLIITPSFFSLNSYLFSTFGMMFPRYLSPHPVTIKSVSVSALGFTILLGIFQLKTLVLPSMQQLDMCVSFHKARLLSIQCFP